MPWPKVLVGPVEFDGGTSDKPVLDFRCREYQNLPALIAHWDTHFWQKSQWFFAVESVLLGAVGVAFKDTFLSGVAPTRPAFLLLVASCVFNFWICYVWFRTNRSNREFLGPLLERARKIEAAILEDNTGTFSAQRESLTSPEHVRHSSHRWENHLPSGFALAWAAVLLAAALYGDRFCLALGTLALSLVALLLLEHFHPKRRY
jgi:hypothetical protein